MPGVLIYTVSYQFVSRSIESWFDVKVEGALDAGLNLGRGTLDALVTDLGDQDAARRRAARRAPRRGRAAGARAAARAALGAGGRASSAAPARCCSPTGSARAGADARAAVAARCCARRARSASSSQLEGLDEDAAAGRHERRACARVALIPSAELRARRAGALPGGDAGAAADAGAPTRWRCRRAYREYQQRALARERPAQDVHRHADAGAGAGGVRRAAAGGRARQPARAAAAAAGRGRAPGGAGRPQREAGVRLARRARRPDALVRRHDRAARPRRASWCSASVVAGRGRAHQPADHPRQPDRRRDRVRPRAAASTPSTRARRASCGCRCRPTAAGGSTRCRASRPSRRRSGSASSCTPRAPRPASATTGRTRSSCRPAARRPRARRDHAAGARRGDAAGRAADGVRRHHRAGLGAAQSRPGARWRAASRTRSRTR